MESPIRRRRPQLLILAILCASAPCLAEEFPQIPQAQDQGKPVGAGARQGVYAVPGEMTLIRDVSTRVAYRPAPPGVATIANPSPQRDLARTLGTDDGFAELSDDDYAAMGSSAGMAGGGPAAHGGSVTTVERMTGSAVTGTLGRVTGSGGLLNGDNLSRSINGPVGAVGNATRGIGNTVMGALAQFPLGTPAATGGGPGN